MTCNQGRELCSGRPCYDEGGDSEKPLHCAAHYMMGVHHRYPDDDSATRCKGDACPDQRTYPWAYRRMRIVGDVVPAFSERRKPGQDTERRHGERRTGRTPSGYAYWIPSEKRKADRRQPQEPKCGTCDREIIAVYDGGTLAGYMHADDGSVADPPPGTRCKRKMEVVATTLNDEEGNPVEALAPSPPQEGGLENRCVRCGGPLSVAFVNTGPDISQHYQEAHCPNCAAIKGRPPITYWRDKYRNAATALESAQAEIVHEQERHANNILAWEHARLDLKAEIARLRGRNEDLTARVGELHALIETLRLDRDEMVESCVRELMEQAAVDGMHPNPQGSHEDQ